jgi:hypothetical protein
MTFWKRQNYKDIKMIRGFKGKNELTKQIGFSVMLGIKQDFQA